MGERVRAVIVPRGRAELGTERINAHCKSHIAGYKCPRGIERRDSIPLSAAGKILKHELREPH